MKRDTEMQDMKMQDVQREYDIWNIKGWMRNSTRSWNKDRIKEVIEKFKFIEIKKCVNEIDGIDAAKYKQMPMMPFFDKGNRRRIKEEFYKAIVKTIEGYSFPASAKACMYYYAACSNSVYYGGFAGGDCPGRTYDDIVDMGDSFITKNESKMDDYQMQIEEVSGTPFSK